jgi:hypothetical protein
VSAVEWTSPNEWTVRGVIDGTAVLEDVTLVIEGGALMFRDMQGSLVRAYGPGMWSEVTPGRPEQVALADGYADRQTRQAQEPYYVRNT